MVGILATLVVPQGAIPSKVATLNQVVLQDTHNQVVPQVILSLVGHQEDMVSR